MITADLVPYVNPNSPTVAADGSNLTSGNAELWNFYLTTYGADDMFKAYAARRNKQLVDWGQAIQTPHGVLLLEQVQQQLVAHGYIGPTDAYSLANAYAMLATPAPSAPPPPTPSASATAGANLSLGVGSLSQLQRPLLYVGLAYLAYEFFLRGRR